LLERHFAHFTLLGQTVLYGSLLGGAGGATVLLRSREDNVSTDSFTFPDHALYFIALASNGPLPHTDVTFFEYPIEKNDIAIKLQNRLEELQGRYNMLQAQHNALLESNHTTEAHLRDAEAAYAGILASRSWQITSPMRRLRRHFGEFHL
jgi:hypothetical protein